MRFHPPFGGQLKLPHGIFVGSVCELFIIAHWDVNSIALDEKLPRNEKGDHCGLKGDFGRI